MNKKEKIKFKPTYSDEVELVLGDEFSFQWSGKDEDGKFIMYNDYAGVNEEGGELKITWNGTSFDPYYFLQCDHLDGNISMDAVTKYHNDNDQA